MPQKIKISKKILSIDNQRVINFMYSDKKNRDSKINFVLISDIGNILYDVDAGRKDVNYALEKMKELINV